MGKTEMLELDWNHLPVGCAAQSLWECLHDGDLLACRSALLNRSLCLEFDIAHLRAATEDVRFLIHLERVTSVRAQIFVLLPGELRVPDGATREEEHRLMEECQAKWREESLGWSEFEASLASDPLSVTNAEMACADDRVALHLSGRLDGEKFNDQYCSLYIRCGGIRAARSDGKPFNLQQLLDLGHEYWRKFAMPGVGTDADAQPTA